MSVDSQEPGTTPRTSRLLSRRRFLTRAGTAAAALTLTAIATEISFPRIPYETDPYNIRDSTIWRLLRGPFGGIMNICGADDKYSNYWQWKKTEIPEFPPSALLRGNYDTYVRDSTIDNVRMSCDGIREVYILTPPPETTWRLIFQTIHQEEGKPIPYETEGNLFTGKLKGPIKFLRGNGDVLIYAFDENGRRVPLSREGPFDRDDQKLPGRLINIQRNHLSPVIS